MSEQTLAIVATLFFVIFINTFITNNVFFTIILTLVMLGLYIVVKSVYEAVHMPENVEEYKKYQEEIKLAREIQVK